MRFLIVKCVSEIIKQYLIILKIFSSFHAAFISFELYSPVSLPLSFLSMHLSISFSCSSSTTEMYTRSKFPAEQLARSSAPFAEKLVIYELANPFPPRFHHPHILTRLPLLRVSSSFRWRNFIEPRPQALVHFLFWRAFIYNLECGSSLHHVTLHRWNDPVSFGFRGNNVCAFTRNRIAPTQPFSGRNRCSFKPLFQNLWCTYRVIFRILRSRPVSRVVASLRDAILFGCLDLVYWKWRELICGS